MNWRFIVQHYPIYLQGIQTALTASLISLVLALVVGLLVGIIRQTSQGFASKLAAGYVTVIRNTPLLVQLYFIYFGLPRLGLTLTAMQTGILGLTLNSGAYIAEIVKSGLQSIPKGQVEAATAIALTVGQRMRLVMIPLAAPRIIPAIGGQFIQLIKDSSLLSILAILEITKAATEVGTETYMFLEAFIVGGIIYWVVCVVLNFVVDRVEKAFKISLKR
jgi:His/Glu/Gln/Arg/opine family amino acid ABC transporter permease subunit